MADRYYEVTVNGGEAFKFPSVTTIMNRVLAKPGLEQWYYRKAVEGFSTLLSRYGQNTPVDSPSLYSLLSTDNLSPHAHRDASADYGKRVHAHLEKLLKGKKVKPTEETEGVHRWYEERAEHISVIASEKTVVCFSKQYAGTVDVIYRDEDAGGLVIADAKTGSFRWNQFLQLEGYRQAWLDTAWARKPERGARRSLDEVVVRLEVLQFPATDPKAYRIFSYVPDEGLAEAWESVLNIYRAERKITNGG